MLKKKFLVLNSCSHETSGLLCSILESNLSCDVQLIALQQNLEVAHYGRPDAYFWVRDESHEIELTSLDKFATVPKIVVLCGKLPRKQIYDFFTGSRADDLIITPLRESEVVFRTMRLLGTVTDEEKEQAKKNILQKFGISQLIGQDPVFLEKISKIPQVADCDATILLTGETGVGKELCARAIHYLSGRSGRPFIPVNCGAIPTNLIENELFGHLKGAYTDAQRNQHGIISEAEGGTLFLDEINCLPQEAQSKLLRLLQDKTYRPLGQTADVKADIRIIAATNADLREKAQVNLFREDLFYRFTITLDLPGLRERSTDIPLLANHFLRKYLKEYSRAAKSLSSAALEKLILYNWPGNIRELENIVQQAVLLSPNSVLTPQDINIPVSVEGISRQELSYGEAKRIAFEKFEKDYVGRLLTCYKGNITHAAKEAQKDRGDFSKLVKKLNLDRKAFLTQS
jgi:DNA-binding NtrC family response regulator